jgi:hypothetical protein
MSSKGSANLWWIIIGAVIALIVVIILLVIFTDKTQGLDRGLSACEGKGGVCAVDNKCPDSTLKNTAFACSGGNTACCLGVPKRCDPANNERVLPPLAPSEVQGNPACGKESVCKEFDKVYYCAPAS